MEDKDIYKALIEEYRQKPIQLFPKKLSCVACMAADKRGINKQVKRKPLIELLVYTIQKPRCNKEWARQHRPLRT